MLNKNPALRLSSPSSQEKSYACTLVLEATPSRRHEPVKRFLSVISSFCMSCVKILCHIRLGWFEQIKDKLRDFSYIWIFWGLTICPDLVQTSSPDTFYQFFWERKILIKKSADLTSRYLCWGLNLMYALWLHIIPKQSCFLKVECLQNI